MVKKNESLKSLKGEKGENALKSDRSGESDSSDFYGEHLGEVQSLIADDLSPAKSLGEAWL